MALFTNNIRQALHRLGWDVRRYPPQEDTFRAEIQQARRTRLLHSQKINVVLDVGANTGQYAQEIRQAGYQGKILSFEPLSDAYSQLSRAAQGDPNWSALRYALGEEEGARTINVSGNSASSSFLPISARHTRVFPGTDYVATEQVTLKRLDTIAPQILGEADRVCLKIDVQGFEGAVLRGAGQTLPRVPVIETEICLVPLYEGQPSPGDLFSQLDADGYALVSLEQGYAEPSSGHVLWVNAIFLRRDSGG